MTHEQDPSLIHNALEAASNGGTIPADLPSEEDRAILMLASDLAAMDFSAAYGQRAALRSRLLDQHSEAREGWSLIGERLMMLKHSRRLVMIATAIVVA